MDRRIQMVIGIVGLCMIFLGEYFISTQFALVRIGQSSGEIWTGTLLAVTGAELVLLVLFSLGRRDRNAGTLHPGSSR